MSIAQLTSIYSIKSKTLAIKIGIRWKKQWLE